jgi:hypothetical protein
MYKKIWKYPLEVETTNVVLMPKGAEILSVGLQDNKPVVWALVNPDEEDKEPKVLEMFGTGESIPYDMGVNRRFLGTLQPIENGYEFAFHLFECL